MEEAQKILWKEVEAHAEDLKALEDEVAGPREKFHNSLQRSIQGMLGVCN